MHFRLVLEEKLGKEIPSSSMEFLEFLEKFLANDFALLDKENNTSIVCAPLSAGGLEPSTKFSKRGGLDTISIFRVGVAGKKVGKVGGLQFLHKQSEIFNNTKVYKQKCFSLS